MKKIYIGMMMAVAATTLLAQVPRAVMVGGAASEKNLLAMRNGHFEDPTLQYWKVDFSEKDYGGGPSDNHQWIALIEDGTRKHVLKMTVPGMDFGAKITLPPGKTGRNISGVEGVRATSYPIPINPEKRYRLTAWVRASTMNARIYAIGRDLKPRIPKGEMATPENTRDWFKGVTMNFSGKGGTAQWADIPSQWTMGTVEYPPKEMTQLAYEHWMKSKYFVIEVVAMDPGERSGYFYIDDVRLEELPGSVEKDCKIIRPDGKTMEQRAIIEKPKSPPKR